MYAHAIPSPLPAAALAFAPFAPEPEAPGSREIAVQALSIRCLRKQYEIREVAQLRGHIDLKAAVAADPQFLAREKKETNWASSSLSN